jgi:hypothetical protein
VTLLLLAVAATSVLAACSSAKTVVCTEYPARFGSPAKTVCKETTGDTSQATSGTQETAPAQSESRSETSAVAIGPFDVPKWVFPLNRSAFSRDFIR